MSDSTRIKLLIAEDEAPLGALLEQFLTSRGHDVTVVRDGDAALAAMRAESFDVALLDIVMPGLDGLQVLRLVREEPTYPEVIIITGNGTVETAIGAMRLGAYDYLTKPYRMAEIDVLVRRAWEKRELALENARLAKRLQSVDPLPELVTQHPPLREVLETIPRVARSMTPVLITGESGTGKEIVARAIHRLSERGRGPLVDIACAAIGGLSVETELFGYENGAFPGADGRRAGLLELASGGTLFMDEIGALERRLQGALLRVLEQGNFFRAGGTQKVAFNARLITATNRDLESLVAGGDFRNDLLYRINTVRLVLPPLRDRRCDIPVLAEHFLARYSINRPMGFAADAIDTLSGYEWPGNVRELRNVIERAVLLTGGDTITAKDLPLPTFRVERRAQSNGTGVLRPLADLERDHIRFVLERVSWHQGRAAAILGISSKTLYRKIREYGFERGASAPPGDSHAVYQSELQDSS
ncbi:MAG: sigma-54-dependent Fis family transcriptional regulator [Gemmatimonadaceae bacterium]|nr:sigma-54-dependent Fis family transcriptional regulator [Gemmatimonadaceae bacterium]